MFRQLILIAALIVVALAQNSKDREEEKVLKECEKEVGYEIPRPPRGRRPSEEEQKKFYCVMSCIAVKIGLVSENGVINKQKIQEKFNVDAEIVKSAVQRCQDIIGDDNCSQISKKVACVVDHVLNRFVTTFN